MAGFDYSSQLMDDEEKPKYSVDNTTKIDNMPPPPADVGFKPQPVADPNSLDNFNNQVADNRTKLEEQYQQLSQPTETPELVSPVEPVSPPAPRQMKFETESKTETSRKLPTGKEAGIQRDIDKVNEEQLKLQEKSNQLQKSKVEIEQARQMEQEQASLLKQNQINQAINQGEQDYQAKLAEREAEFNKYKEMQLKDYWADKTTNSKITAAIAVALGALGQGMSRSGSNYALDIINKNIDMDFARQREAIEKQKQIVEGADKGLLASRANRDDQLRSLSLKQAAAKEAVADRYESMMKAKGLDEATIQGDSLLLKLREDAAQQKMKIEQDLRSTQKIETQKKVVDIAKEKREGFKDEQALRKEFLDHPDVKNYNTVASGYEKIKAASPSGAGDLSLIYGYMKMLDPSSTVRESEYANAQNAAGVPDQVRTMFNKIKDGDKLSDGQRASFKKEARQVMAAQEVRVKPIRDQYTGLAKDYSMDPKKVILFQPVDLSAPQKEQAPEKQDQGTQPKQTPAPHGERVKQGGVWFKWDGKEYKPE